jgi:hypothetical protein
MRKLSLNLLPLVRRSFAVLFSFLAVAVAPAVRAAQTGGGTVGYTPLMNTLTGYMPFTQSFVVSVMSPVNFPPATAATIGFVVTPTMYPDEMTYATAQSLITVAPVDSGTFTGANQVRQFTVTGSFPVVPTAPGAAAVTYAYQIYTSNWPASAIGPITDGGFAVGATATVPSGGGSSTQPPTVAITSPASGTVLSYPSGTVFPVQVPLTFVGGAPAGSLVDSLTANLGGRPLSISSPALPQGSVSGSASMAIAGPGAYTAQVGAYNNIGSATATTNFTVVVAAQYAPPDLAITTPVDASTITVAPSALPLTLPVQFSSTSTGSGASPITAVSASYGEANTPVVLTSTGLNSTAVSSAGTIVMAAPGSYCVMANATNLGGTGTDTNTVTIIVQADPPTVVIHTPTVNSVYSHRLDTPATIVPFAFTATSRFGGIDTLTAKVDGANVVFTPVGLGTATATGLINLPYTTAGTHTVSVTTTDDNGTATADSNFTVDVIAPTPTVVINQPPAGATFATPGGSTTVNVPYAFTATSNNGFFVDSVSLSLEGAPVVMGGTSGLGTATATGTGTLTGVTAGTHALVATAISSGISVTTATTFTVASTLPPPTVVIHTPAAGATFTRVAGGPAVSIPLTFTGTSLPTNGAITQLKATVDCTALPVASTTLGQRVAHGAATMSVSSAGTHTLTVTAIDAYGTASATRTFAVVVVQPRTVYGASFFDVDGDGRCDAEDFDLSTVTVKLYTAANVLVGGDVTDSSGDYAFCNVAPGTYRVVATASAGLKASTVGERTVTVAGANVSVPRIGFSLDFAAMRTMKADGDTTADWKHTLDKAIGGKTPGTPGSKAALERSTRKIAHFALKSFDHVTLKTAAAMMGYSGTNPTSLLAKHLIAAEYNYQNAAYIGGNKTLTMAFLWWGEYVLAHSGKYSSADLIRAKDWFDAYNSSQGGPVNGPL